MTFRDWQQLSPADAAREIHRRVRTALAPGQQRAAIARLPEEGMLAAALGAADRAAPLGGVPFFLKDLFDLAGDPTFAGSTFLPEVRPTPPRDAAIVTALRAAGAVCAGKTHLHEFAYGITGENPHYGDCEHPRFPGRTSGGSSSGSAAVVAAGIVPLAVGTDTGGSVRVPAAFCGLYGFRTVPRDRLISDAFPLAPSFDTAGWFTADAADLLAATDALLGLQTSSTAPRGGYLELPGLDPAVALACQAAAGTFAPPADELTGATLAEGFRPALDCYNTTVAAEAWATHLPWATRYQARYDPAVWSRLVRGQALTASDCARAEEGIGRVRRLFADYFDTFDFLILPATPCEALRKTDCSLENRRRLLSLTAPASLAGLPVLTLPVALPSGLSTGLQFIARSPQSSAFRWALTAD